MTIRITNASFQSTSAGDFATVDEAYRMAIVAGLEIAAAEVRTGVDSALVEVAIDLVGQQGAARGAVTISAGRFAVPPPA